jgi:hypothetical protein
MLRAASSKPFVKKAPCEESPGPAAITVGKVYPGWRARCPLVTPPGQAFCGLLFNEARPQFEFHRSKLLPSTVTKRWQEAGPGGTPLGRSCRSAIIGQASQGPGSFAARGNLKATTRLLQGSLNSPCGLAAVNILSPIIGAAESPREIAAPHRHATQKLMGLTSRGIPGCLFPSAARRRVCNSSYLLGKSDAVRIADLESHRSTAPHSRLV